jgi:hypothetical protein
VGATPSASLARRRCATLRTCWNEAEKKPDGQSAQAGIPGGEHGLTGQVERWTGRAVAGDRVVRCARCYDEAARGQEGRYAGAAREEGRDAEGRPQGCRKPKDVSQIGQRITRREQNHKEVGGEEECEEGNSDGGPTVRREDGRQIGGKEDDRQGGCKEVCRQVGGEEGCGEKAVRAEDDREKVGGWEDSPEEDGYEKDGYEENGYKENGEEDDRQEDPGAQAGS